MLVHELLPEATCVITSIIANDINNRYRSHGQSLLMLLYFSKRLLFCVFSYQQRPLFKW